MPVSIRSALASAAAVLAAALALAPPARADDHHRSARPDFGPNVKVLDPSMSTAQIKAIVDPIAAQQVDAEFGTGRYAILFRPGTYGSAADPLNFQVGYGTQVAGLGASPRDVTVNGTIDVFNRCEGNPKSCIALTNFWRSLENVSINVAGKSGCPGAGEFWATSQAAPMRRVRVNGFTTLFDFCTQPNFASGGFIADSQFTGTVVNGSQQQYFVRNSDIGGWSNGVWNQVFAGVKGAPAQSFPNPPYTTLPTTPVSREKPFLRVDAAGHWSVFVPDAQTASSGTTWAAGPTRGRAIPLERFFIAKPSDSAREIDRALDRGQNLLFTPGVYAIDRPLEVKRPGTVVLGLGMATLDARRGVVPLTVRDARDVVVAGLILDAGPQRSPALLRVSGGHRGGARQPTLLSDVFFRIGGPHVGRVGTALAVDADDVILDDIWAWRADHGNGVGWTVNTADHGVVVNGDDVTATGLFVEHFQKEEVLWRGERGRTVMFQNEMPYDPPSQAAFTRRDGTLGYPAYEVAPSVRTHEGWGLGSYCFFNVDPSIHASRGFQVPVTPGVRLHDVLTLSISDTGTIDHVVNDTGAPTPHNTTPSTVVNYP